MQKLAEHKGTATDGFRATLEQQRRAWSKKSLLRRVYRGYYRHIMARSSPLRPIVEIGAGAGFFKEYCPESIATDIVETPWTERVADGCDLPFDDHSVGNLVLIDVFHHLDHPAEFLREASRVLKRGGRIVMLEPWTSTMGYPFYRYVHHEGANRNVDLAEPFATQKEAFDGNPALPKLYFGDASPGSRIHGEYIDLIAVDVEPLPGANWLISGGFRPFALLPGWMWPVADLAETLTTPLSGLIALRALITLERPLRGPVSLPVSQVMGHMFPNPTFTLAAT